jgi:predicted tellurium resistance membrane protein TerC
MHNFILAAPFLVAIGLYLLSPLTTNLVVGAVVAAIDKGRAIAGKVDETQVPIYLAPETISDYVEFAADGAQVIPAIVLPIVGAIYAFSSVPAPADVSLLIAAFFVAIGMLAWMLTRPAAEYVSLKKYGFSLLTVVGVAFNLAGMSLALALAS